MFAALAVAWLIEHRTGWSIKKFVAPGAATAPARSTGQQTLPAEDPLPNDLRDSPALIT
jgi:hypothetical protein